MDPRKLVASVPSGVEAVVNAWQDPGPRPDLHEIAKRDLKRRWPTLALAIERLVFEHSEEVPEWKVFLSSIGIEVEHPSEDVYIVRYGKHKFSSLSKEEFKTFIETYGKRL